MPEILPYLVHAPYTEFFLKLDLVKVFSDQYRRLRAIDRNCRKLLLHSSKAYWKIQSKLEQVMSGETTDFAEVADLVNEKENINSRLEIERIHYALEAIQVLDHPQHLEIWRNAMVLLKDKSTSMAGM
jgi:hypothetical protein